MFLPDEFELKKYIVDLVIALNILLCKFIDALVLTDTNVAHLMRVANIREHMKTAKTVIHVCREIAHHNKVPDVSSVDAVLSDVYVNVLLSIALNVLISTIFAR